jgi:hypothetical protein
MVSEQAAGQREVRRQHADNEVRCVLDRDGLPDDVRTAGKATLPVAVREHHGLGDPRDIVAGTEEATRHRRRAEHRQELMCHPKAVHPFWRLGPGDGEDVRCVAGPGADLLERSQVLLPVGELRQPVRADHRLASVARSAVVCGDPYEPFGIGERESLGEYRVCNRERRCRGADAERQRAHDHGRQRGRTSPRSCRDAHRLPEAHGAT